MHKFPLSNINLLSSDEMTRLKFTDEQIAFLNRLTPLETITSLLLHGPRGNELFDLALTHGLVASVADTALFPVGGVSDTDMPTDSVGQPNTIDDCSTVKTENIVKSGTKRVPIITRTFEVAQAQSDETNITLDQWHDAEKKAVAEAEALAKSNRSLAIGSLAEKYKCTNPDCRDPVLTIRLWDLKQAYSQPYRDVFAEAPDMWREWGWETKCLAPAKVTIRCGNVT